MIPSERSAIPCATTLYLINHIQILIQIQQTAVQSQRALSISQQQTAAKDRERRILQLTIDEISQIRGDVNLYKGIGKMCVDHVRM